MDKVLEMRDHLSISSLVVGMIVVSVTPSINTGFQVFNCSDWKANQKIRRLHVSVLQLIYSVSAYTGCTSTRLLNFLALDWEPSVQ